MYSERCGPQFASPRACFLPLRSYIRGWQLSLFSDVSFPRPGGSVACDSKEAPAWPSFADTPGVVLRVPVRATWLLGSHNRGWKRTIGSLFSGSLVLARKASRMRLQRWLCTRLFPCRSEARFASRSSAVLQLFESHNLRLTRTGIGALARPTISARWACRMRLQWQLSSWLFRNDSGVALWGRPGIATARPLQIPESNYLACMSHSSKG